MVKVRYSGESDDLTFIDGKEYVLKGYQKIGDDYYPVIIDEVGDPDLCSPDSFEISSEGYFSIVSGDIDTLPVYEYDKKLGKNVRIK